jgi:hypothetical protein
MTSLPRVKEDNYAKLGKRRVSQAKAADSVIRGICQQPMAPYDRENLVKAVGTSSTVPAPMQGVE